MRNRVCLLTLIPRYGGTAPRLRGATIIDLKRMDRILEVNEESAYCLVQPGVSYFNMYEHLQKIGSNLWIDCPDIGWGSMVGNMTERGAGVSLSKADLFFTAAKKILPPPVYSRKPTLPLGP